MGLAILVLFLIVWAGYSIVKKIIPPDPPIDDLDTYAKRLMQCRNQKEKKRFIRQDAARRRAELLNKQKAAKEKAEEDKKQNGSR